jgi:hypothetical protein
MIKTILLTISLIISLQASSYWDQALKSANSVWEKTKDVSSDTLEKTKEVSSDTWEQTKKYSHKGKNRTIEQSVIHGLNALVDTSKIKIEDFSIDDKTDKITMTIMLDGEDHELNIKLDNFDWGVSKDEKYIVFKNIDLSLDIEWLDYLLHDTIKRDNGYYVVNNSASTYSMLYTIKSPVKVDWTAKDKHKFDWVYYQYDKDYINLTKFDIIKSEQIKIKAKLKGSMKDLVLDISHYNLMSAQHRKYIVLKDIKFKTCSKPWIQSLIHQQDDMIILDFIPKVWTLFGGAL